MRILFAKPKIEICSSVSGVPDGNWVTVDTPKEDSTSLETNEGTDLEAREEGGEVVDRVGQASSYNLNFELFKKKGEAMLLNENENSGLVSGEYAIRVTSGIDGEAPGFQMDRASAKTARLYSVQDTYRKQYSFSALKPASGDTVKDVENTVVTTASGSTTVNLLEKGMTAGNSADFSTKTINDSGATPTISLTLASGKTTGVIEVRGAGYIHIITVNKVSE